MRTYDRVLDGKTFWFRLTIGKQRELREKYSEETVQTILTAPYDLDKLSYLLGAAASWPGNDNPTTDGDEIYDLLVDDGVCGSVSFVGVVAMIAAISGIVDEKMRDTFSQAAQREWDSVMASFSGETVDPTSPQRMEENPPKPEMVEIVEF